MATIGLQHYETAGHHPNYLLKPDQLRPRSMPASVVIPDIPQSVAFRDDLFHQPQYQRPLVNALQGFELEQAFYNTHRDDINKYVPQDNRTFNSVETKLRVDGMPSRSETLKRRPSLRETARSICSSRVAKRLCRQGRPDHHPEDENDAGASASESDSPVDAVLKHQMNPSYNNEIEPQQRPSVVSSLVNNIQSSLTIRTNMRDRGYSSASQSSNRLLDNSDAASTRTSITTWSNVSHLNHPVEDDEPDKEDEEDSDGYVRRPATTAPSDPESPQLFACPFAKFDSKRYSAANLREQNYRGCSQCYLTDLARVKQHLYRVHVRPQHHCPNCFEVFKSQAQCMKHVSARVCSARACPFDEKMTPQQLIAIKKKNRGMDLYLGWYEIYKTLFPGAQLPMSPFASFTATVDDLETFMNFVIREIPTRLQTQLGQRHPLNDIVQGSLPDVLREIRRDFNPLAQQRLEVSTQGGVADSPTEAARRHSPVEINFHQMATLPASQQDQNVPQRPESIDLQPNLYQFPSAQTSRLSLPPASEAQFQNSLYSQHHQQIDYNTQDQNLMTRLASEPLTAIYQPNERDSQHDYFIGSHQSGQPLPGYSLHFEAGESWLPTMVTTVPDHSMNHHHSVQDILHGLYQGGYST